MFTCYNDVIGVDSFYFFLNNSSQNYNTNCILDTKPTVNPRLKQWEVEVNRCGLKAMERDVTSGLFRKLLPRLKGVWAHLVVAYHLFRQCISCSLMNTSDGAVSYLALKNLSLV